MGGGTRGRGDEGKAMGGGQPNTLTPSGTGLARPLQNPLAFLEARAKRITADLHSCRRARALIWITCCWFSNEGWNFCGLFALSVFD